MSETQLFTHKTEGYEIFKGRQFKSCNLAEFREWFTATTKIPMDLSWGSKEAGPNSFAVLSFRHAAGYQKIKRDFHNDARWIGPSVETLATAIDAWLVAQDYGSAPSTDGSTKRGWHLTNKGCYHYVEFVVEPHWQVYGK